MLPPQLFQNALESAPDAIIICDGSGAVVFANRQVEALFGYSSDEIVGRDVECLLPERLSPQHVDNRESYARSPRVRPMGAGLALFARRKNGHEFPVEISLSPIPDGNRTLIAAAIRDVADRKRIESELVAAREAADRANRAKSRFLATASHDLRQPLQVLALLNGTLRRTASDPVASEALAHQEQAIGSMSRLLNALLDISKLESGAIKPQLSDFTVSELFEELRREFASLAAIKGLALLVEPCADRVCSDPSLMEQILRNLISNAIKYTHVGTVSLRCARQAGTVRIEVLDTGVGIPAEQMPYIFDEFFQIGITPNSTHDGYGLGLSIVSRLAKLLNAVLEVQSELGRGTSFSIELPAGVHHVGSEHTAAGPAPRAVEAVREGRRVLLVEDDAAVRNATRMLLRAGGYEVFTAGSHTEALQKLHEHQSLDLLITDYHLGSGETGVQVINSMRAALGAEFKAILITGDTSPQIKGLSLDEHLRVASKPIQADELLLLIRELLTS